jgi:hypothetical protein
MEVATSAMAANSLRITAVGGSSMSSPARADSRAAPGAIQASLSASAS